MPNVVDLVPVRAKFARAVQHLEEMRSKVDRISAQTPVHITTHADGDWIIGTAQMAEPLDIADFPVIIGDIVSNLRGALDYLAWQLVIRNGGQPTKRTNWPCALTENRWNSVVKNDLCGMSHADITEIRRWQPFMDNRNEPNLLHVLDYVNNFNKHRTLPVAFAAPDRVGVKIDFDEPARGTEQITFTPCWEELTDGGEVLRIRCADMTSNYTVTLPAAVEPTIKMMGYDFPFTVPDDWGYEMKDLVELVDRIIASFDPAVTNRPDVSVPTRKARTTITY